MGAAYTLGGRVADAVPLLTQAVEQSHGHRRGIQAVCRIFPGGGQLLAGRLEEALSLAQQALELARAHKERGNEA